MTPIEVLFAYLISLAASLRGSAIDQGRQARLQSELEQKAEYFRNIEAARPLRDELRSVGNNLGRMKAALGLTPTEEPLFQLLQDETFQNDLGEWILAENSPEALACRKRIAERIVKALEDTDIPAVEIERFQEQYFDLVERQVFSNQVLSNWRQAVRMQGLERQIAEEGAATREAVRTSGAEIRVSVDDLASALIRTHADDMATLRNYTNQTLGMLARAATITVGEDDVKIDRAVIDGLREGVDTGSVVVVGDPGAGKSVAMHDLAVVLKREGLEAILFDVQRIHSGSLGQLRVELNLTNELASVFKDWPGQDPKFLIIDAFDAARSGPVAKTIQDLITVVMANAENWRVIVSIRKFDLRYNEELRRLFKGVPPSEYCDPEFKVVRHVNVPLLTDEEWGIMGRQSSELGTLIASANEDLRSLLRIIFNCRLVAELLDAGEAVSALTPIRTQVELLNRYWRARVIRAGADGDARESVAFLAAREMVRARSLTIPRVRVTENPAASEPLGDLLSANVLTEWLPPGAEEPDRYTLTFSHNMLFDYAAERSLLHSRSRSVAQYLADEPDLILAIRPSIVFHYQRLWSTSQNREQFWRTVFEALQTPKLPRIGQLVGPAVAVDLAEDIADFQPLLDALRGSDAAKRRAAEDAVAHLAGALLATNTPLVGDSAGPWADWMEQVARFVNDRTAGTLRVLLSRCLND